MEIPLLFFSSVGLQQSPNVKQGVLKPRRLSMTGTDRASGETPKTSARLLYTNLLTSDKLNRSLADIDGLAEDMFLRPVK